MDYESTRDRFLKLTDAMLSESPHPCRFKVGDKVKFTNDHGLEFGPYSVVGFAKPENELKDQFIYIDYACAWYPVKPEELSKWVPKPWLVRDIGSLTLVYADTAEEGLTIYREKHYPDDLEPDIFSDSIYIEPLPGPEKPISLLWTD